MIKVLIRVVYATSGVSAWSCIFVTYLIACGLPFAEVIERINPVHY